MNSPKQAILQRFLVLTASAVICACSTVGQRGIENSITPDPLTSRIITTLDQTNADLRSFKGIGNIKLWKENTAQVQERMAWIGAAPSRLRVVVFASGRPALKMATNGKRLYAVDFYNPNRTFYESPAPNFGLKRLLSLPLKPEDMVTLLSGRIPLADHHTARMHPSPTGDGYVVNLLKWSRVVQRIYLDGSREKVQKIEMFGKRGSLSYRVEFASLQVVQGYRVPFMLNISDDAGNRMHLAIERYIADIDVDPSIFVLKPPDEK